MECNLFKLFKEEVEASFLVHKANDIFDGDAEMHATF